MVLKVEWPKFLSFLNFVGAEGSPEFTGNDAHVFHADDFGRN